MMELQTGRNRVIMGLQGIECGVISALIGRVRLQRKSWTEDATAEDRAGSTLGDFHLQMKLLLKRKTSSCKSDP